MGNVGIIAAMTLLGVIAENGKIPWHKPEDLKRFKRITQGSTLIMGRKTWDSIGRKELPLRRSVVLSRSPLDGVKRAGSIEEALQIAQDPDWGPCPKWEGTKVWVIGGAEVYNLAMPFVDIVDITTILDTKIIPSEFTTVFNLGGCEDIFDFRVRVVDNTVDPTLRHIIFERRTPCG